MKLKYNITSEEYDVLDGSVQSFYEESNGAYVLTVEGLPPVEDVGPLKRAKDHEKNARKEAEAKVRELEQKLRDIEDRKHRDKGDVEALEASYKKKIQDIEANSKAEIDRLTEMLKRNTVDAEAMRISSELSGPNADLILPHVRARMLVDLNEEGPKVRVLDEKGQVTADTLEDLKNYFFTSERFAPLVIGSKATGSGASGPKSGGGSHKKLSEMTATEEALFAKQNPQQYEQMLAKERIS